jgi:hypothetical protein
MPRCDLGLVTHELVFACVGVRGLKQHAAVESPARPAGAATVVNDLSSGTGFDCWHGVLLGGDELKGRVVG